VVGAEHAGSGFQDGAVFGFGFCWPSQGLQGVGEVATAGQGVGVVGAEHAGSGFQDGAVFGLGFC